MTVGADEVHNAEAVITLSWMTVDSTVEAVTHVAVKRTEGTFLKLEMVADVSVAVPFTKPDGGFTWARA